MELIELQRSETPKAKYDSVGAAQFARFIPDIIPQLRIQGAQTLSMFGRTYLCEQLFSLMKLKKASPAPTGAGGLSVREVDRRPGHPADIRD